MSWEFLHGCDRDGALSELMPLLAKKTFSAKIKHQLKVFQI